MRSAKKCSRMILAVLLAAGYATAQHIHGSSGATTSQQPAQTDHMHPQPPQVPPAKLAPQPAREPDTGGPILTLEAVEKMALENNPTLAQATAEVRAARARRLQSGLYPNPVVGYTGEEIRGGASRGGQQGFFVEQDIVLGGKLGLSRQVAGHEISLAEIEAEEQRLRVRNSVRIAFYRALAAQELLDAQRAMARLAFDALSTGQRLRNIGQSDEAEVLQAQIELQQAELAVLRQEDRFRAAWHAMAAQAGNPRLPVGTVQGDLEAGLPELDGKALLEELMTRSPAVRIAQASVRRAEAQLSRARREPIPDLRVRAGMEQNRELLEPTGRPVGLQAFAEIGVQLPLFNRNQGNVEAARATHERAQQEVRRVQLVLFERASQTLESYNTARVTADRYRSQLLPAARRAHELMLMQWGQMRVSYPQLLQAQRTLFGVQAGYISALEDVWTNALALQAFLLTDGLEAPARPGEVDLPVRDVNLPRMRIPTER